MNVATSGVLHLIPVTLGDDNVRAVLPSVTLDIVAAIDYFIVENEKSARRFLGSLPHPRPLRQVQHELFDKNGTPAIALQLLQPLTAGRSAAVLSEAGCP